jgi:hypothetical protein
LPGVGPGAALTRGAGAACQRSKTSTAITMVAGPSSRCLASAKKPYDPSPLLCRSSAARAVKRS